LLKYADTKGERKHHMTGKQLEKKKNKNGRPPEKPPQKIVDELLQWIADGKTLRAYCRQDNVPAWRTIYHWLDKDPEFLARIAHARDMGADAIAEETLEIIDTMPMSAGGDNPRLDSAHVAWMKNRVELRMKLLSKWNPKKYGDKVGVQHEGSFNLVVSTGVPGPDDD
tara:strand:+ start:710 stop:1213 length:504 start_codon:yes stop_codon:yes gene_type:complete